MLQRLKHKQDKERSLTVPWRPDFRNASDLPDVKSVRTRFLINAVSLSVLAIVLMVMAERELSINSARLELRELEVKINEIQPKSDKAVSLLNEFQVEEKKFKEVSLLKSSDFSFIDFTLGLAALLPENIVINRIDYRGPGRSVLVSAFAKGQDTTAGEQVDAFVGTVRQQIPFKENFSLISLPNITRNSAENSISFEVLFTFKGSIAKNTSK